MANHRYIPEPRAPRQNPLARLRPNLSNYKRPQIIAVAALALLFGGTGAGVAVALDSSSSSPTAACGQPTPQSTDDQGTVTFGFGCTITVPQQPGSTTTLPGSTETQTVTSTAPGPTTTKTVSGPTVTVTASSSPSTSTSTSSSTPPPPPGTFPNATNTGPSGTLSTYTGPLTITSCGVVISNMTINGSLRVGVGNGTHSASTPCVTINNSIINGVVGTGASDGSDGPLVLNHVEVSAPTTSNVQAVALSNFYLDSVNVHGGANGGVECYGYCSISNSWIHDFYNAGSTHYDGIISNGTSGHPLVIDHNTVGCNFYASAPGGNGGCSADLGLFGDFGTISNVTVSNNLFLASPTSSIPGSTSAFCMYGGDVSGKKFPTSSNVVVTGNTFQRGPNKKCGLFGAIADFDTTNGNAWSGNVWDDGTVLPS